MVDQDGLVRALAAALLGSGGHSAVAAICQACVAFLPASGAGVTVMVSVNTQYPVYATDPVAARIDAVQFALAEGPCVDAFRSGQPVLVTDIAAAEELRWPAFTSAISDTAVRGVYVFPLRVGARRLGVLNVYREGPGVLDAVELAGGLRASDSVVLALLESGLEESTLMGSESQSDAGGGNLFETGGERSAGMGAALGTDVAYRAEVHQATGMITEQAGVDAASALARLRAAAFAADRSIEELALDVIARRVRFEPNGDTPIGGERTGPGDDTPG